MRAKHLFLVALILLAFVAYQGTGLALTYTVTNTNDSGPGSLRRAIDEANANPGLDTIVFNIPGAGVHTIQPDSALPEITDPIRIDGYTQSGAQPNTNPVGQGLNTVLKIELDGSNAGTSINAKGLRISAGNSMVKGLVINRFAKGGIYMNYAGGNIIEGNFIGMDVSGTTPLGNRYGVSITGGTAHTIGGTSPAARNLISGNNETGVWISTDGNTVQGNLIGTDMTGTIDMGNGDDGVTISHSYNTIGGHIQGAGNVISGNDVTGVRTSSTASAEYNLIQGNYIGTDVTGTLAIGNSLTGVSIYGQSYNNTIGGTTSDAGNIIAFNGSYGGVMVGPGRNNAILGNSIFSNDALGIDLNPTLVVPPDGVTPNDIGDGDTGGNDLQNHPELISVSVFGPMIHIQGSLNSTPNSDFRIQFFDNQECDPSGYGEGAFYIGTKKVSTNATGDVFFSATFLIPLPFEQFITATATDPLGNTSEFSLCQEVTEEEITCVDFEDLAVSDTYPVGIIFMSDDMTFETQPFQYTNGTWTSDGIVQVDNSGLACHAGQDIMISNINLEFKLDTPWPSISLYYGEYGGNLNITINGVYQNVANFGVINGTTIGGVAVSATGSIAGDGCGYLVLSGIVNSLILGGQELWIDHICPFEDPDVAGACCDGDGDCYEASASDCYSQGGSFGGGGTMCLGDNDGDGSDDACSIPSGDKGDVDGNGESDIIDVVLLVNGILGLAEFSENEFWRADCNGDGHNNVLDALGIVLQILGLEECPSSCDELDCDDGNPCTEDYCDRLLIQCVHVKMFGGTPCDDGDLCTENDICLGGACQGTPKDCDDGDPCTEDNCNPLDGFCYHSYIGEPEICDDGLDNDCDGFIDCDDDECLFDYDGDGYYGEPCGDDCDDNDDDTYPGAPELCDGEDNDCDGQVPADESDSDQDGSMVCEGDCDDGDDDVYPGAPEICDDGKDNDCDGFTDCDDSDCMVDADGDGYYADPCGDCDDGDDDVYPGAIEICDGKDNDCDGQLPFNEADGDGDGYMVCEGDCDDNNDDVYPGAPEDCDDGVDNDCDGYIDGRDLDDCP